MNQALKGVGVYVLKCVNTGTGPDVGNVADLCPLWPAQNYPTIHGLV